MTRPAFRPRLVGLEDRLTPATPDAVVADIAQMRANTEILQYAIAHPQIGLAPANQAQALSVMATITAQSQQAAADLSDFLANLQSQTAADPSLTAFFAPYATKATVALAQAQANIAWSQFGITQINAAAGTTGTGISPPGTPTPPVTPAPPVSPAPPVPDTLPPTPDNGTTNATPPIP
jgi:hypothetical protein